MAQPGGEMELFMHSTMFDFYERMHDPNTNLKLGSKLVQQP